MPELRQVIKLDGIWEIAEGDINSIPLRFPAKVPVPGLVDLAKPEFDEVGVKSKKREAFWYRRTFTVDSDIPEVAQLKMYKAKYGMKVYLNGQSVGENSDCFIPAYFDVHNYLKGGGAENELVIRLGAFHDAIPINFPNGGDAEKKQYIPGIYDSVDLILSEKPYILNIQTVPNIESKSVRAVVRVESASNLGKVRVDCKIREFKSREVVGSAQMSITGDGESLQHLFDIKISIENCRLWSPEDPFLYELEACTGSDMLKIRFGMRSFRFDKYSGRAILNGKEYYLRGTNICMYRFFEDSERFDRPWRKDWVRRLHKKIRGMNWNSARYCIGFPPEFWYEIADEEGILIQDEFPIWNFVDTPEGLSSKEIARQYTKWMEERWNHPCVVIWDGQNETRTNKTGEAIEMVRDLDLSNRPWDNGWSPPQRADDCYESHPYVFNRGDFKLSDIPTISLVPRGGSPVSSESNAIVINEYGWLWLNRDGTPTKLTKGIWDRILGPDASAKQLRRAYAERLAALTEFWRCNRVCAGVMHFCILGYSRPETGMTSDHWIDVEKLEFEPEFEKYVKGAFSPVGLMIDEWAEELPGGVRRDIDIVVINDTYDVWEGKVRFRIVSNDGSTVIELFENCFVSGLGDRRFCFRPIIPHTEGRYEIIAELVSKDTPLVQSIREFKVTKTKSLSE